VNPIRHVNANIDTHFGYNGTLTSARLTLRYPSPPQCSIRHQTTIPTPRPSSEIFTTTSLRAIPATSHHSIHNFEECTSKPIYGSLNITSCSDYVDERLHACFEMKLITTAVHTSKAGTLHNSPFSRTQITEQQYKHFKKWCRKRRSQIQTVMTISKRPTQSVKAHTTISLVLTSPNVHDNQSSAYKMRLT